MQGVVCNKLQVIGALVRLQKSGMMEKPLGAPVYLLPFTERCVLLPAIYTTVNANVTGAKRAMGAWTERRMYTTQWRTTLTEATLLVL